ncbi:MAG: TerC family protein, partial [Planctomycetaceae bacterium]
MMELLTTQALAALFTLTALELVLGIDNIIFIAILCGRLPPTERDR